ncbi:hypothetical protein V6N13_148543 [Hibiscus sabdariffa]
MPPRRETSSRVGVPVEGQNVDVRLVHPNGLPPPPPIPHVGRGLRQAVVDSGKRAVGSGFSMRPGKNFRDGLYRPERKCDDFGRGSRVQPYAGTSVGVPLCERCNKCHPGECRWATGACVACGSMDHRRRDCPRVVGEMVIRTEVGVAPARG